MTMNTAALDVSRETLERLELLHALLKKWNPAINLVSRSSLDQAWDRHIMDSAQIFSLGADHGHWVDLGSGGGFPGLVVACMAAGQDLPIRVTMIEADQRKATFLRLAVDQLSINANVIAQRIEKASPQNAQTVSARALAPLPLLLSYAARHISPDGSATCLFLKGANWRQEVELARKDWQFELQVHQSTTDPEGAILAVRSMSHV
ncbi:16S rRNA (guanine(527)-N(7))-methyltransferase RsmG [Tabrizicola sp. TH137]|uniref:16S rRNA (guanine(527)-N(7))-methyltransferase RsmG n=1 Tax=Tabrizicola sp. TH137 TaxID=2067452 RepID=UPI000C7CC5CB|nr:16S rRNA (guanine(527)-N(7))-methyltransferase RsmG [Tabrizicola sp. TH137]PLL14686.1 16S rRNA (guanine(527)-N(7))-methyltransferase RsmG [Tabrizicola sp. TH137]